MAKSKNDALGNIGIIAIVLVAVLILYNQYQISTVTALVSNQATTGAAVVSLNGIDVIPKGVPAIYGAELGVSFDDISPSDQNKADATIAKLGQLDNQITLSGDLEQRYIKIASQIACEYCCGAQALIFPDGSPACGCAHSAAMRGLAKYLLQNHASQYTDDQILEELGKWKTLFFPGIITQKAAVLKQKGIELNYINLASNKYRGIENGVQTSGGSGSMVGGC